MTLYKQAGFIKHLIHLHGPLRTSLGKSRSLAVTKESSRLELESSLSWGSAGGQDLDLELEHVRLLSGQLGDLVADGLDQS